MGIDIVKFKQKEKVYSTTDLYLASYLKARGLNFLGIGKETGKTIFLFEDSEKRYEYLQDFLNNQNVRIGDFLQALGNLKKLIFKNF